ncbi:LOW QUALITY PROTEIN: ATP-dependent Clp protease ATP-binding subunit [Frankliniella fusca]|uniref:ATP-dependent Clp protease ATP-binding subunit n=1 Tax=Frankliniella fusca TaxID=407009 RepID=A0AAE1H5P6_9NEOP|nr:LOW QUALITY PROTEIN: ATP-dependent Clp protease ATP-binding subunit [Frankliniella fusca]
MCVTAGELRLDIPLQAEHSKNKGFVCFWWRNACLGAGFITHRLSCCSVKLRRLYPQSLNGLVKSDVPVVPTVSSEHSDGRRCHGGMGRLLHRPFFHLSYCSCCNSATLANWYKFKVPELFNVEYQSLVMTMVLLTRNNLQGRRKAQLIQHPGGETDEPREAGGEDGLEGSQHRLTVLGRLQHVDLIADYSHVGGGRGSGSGSTATHSLPLDYAPHTPSRSQREHCVCGVSVYGDPDSARVASSFSSATLGGTPATVSSLCLSCTSAAKPVRQGRRYKSDLLNQWADENPSQVHNDFLTPAAARHDVAVRARGAGPARRLSSILPSKWYLSDAALCWNCKSGVKRFSNVESEMRIRPSSSCVLLSGSFQAARSP